MTDSPKRVLLYGDQSRADVAHAVAQVEPLVRDFAELVESPEYTAECDLEKLEFDLLINFGGDGSILGAVRSMGHNQRPIAGVNFGKIGFLASFEMPEILRLLTELLSTNGSKNINRNELLMLHGRIVRRNGEVVEHLALNDAVISRGVLSRIIELDVSIANEPVCNYRADGLIISTPAGSTAHALGAGAPVLEPSMKAFIVVPICPHSLAVRPVVAPSHKDIAVLMAHSSVQVGVTFDGQVFEILEEGDRLLLSAFEKEAILLSPREPGFYQRLQTKMHWGAGFMRVGPRDADVQ